MSGPHESSTPPKGVTRLRIETWAAGGRGLGRVDGRVWMVVGGVPGDVVLARMTRDHGRFVDAVADRLEQPSPARRQAACPLQAVCGACPMMVVDEASQGAAKRQFLIDALHRIGRLPATVPVGPMVTAPAVLSYRNKIELTFGRDHASGRVVGYHRADAPSALIDVEDCAVADPRLQPLLASAREFFLRGPGASDPAIESLEEPLRLVLRTSGKYDERLIAFRGQRGPFPTVEAFARLARGIDPGLVGVVRLLAPSGRRGGAAVETIAGRAWIEDEICGTSFRVPAATFLQVHPGAAERLGAHGLEGAGSPQRVVELYGGIGAFGLALARRGASVTIVDADPAAIACGIEAARSHDLGLATFERADVRAFLDLRSDRSPPDLVIADPPRTGLGRGVAEKLAGLRATRVAMVSCDPATLARDLAALTARGYTVEQVTPFDLFPQTAHVEAVAWLARAS